MTYGLGAVGLTPRGLYKIQVMITQQLRFIAGDLAQETHTTNEQFYHNFQWPTPLELMQQALSSQEATVQVRYTMLPDYDIVLQTTWDTLIDSSALLVQAQMQNVYVAALPLEDTTVSCPVCQQGFQSQSALSQHMYRMHGIQSLSFTTVDYATDAVGDIPQCSHCGVILGSWKQFRTHVSRHHSKLAKAPSAQPTTDELRLAQWKTTDQGGRILALLTASPLIDLASAPVDCAWLACHCILCGIYLDGLGGMTYHLKHARGKLASRTFQVAAGLWRSLPQESPCMMCTKSFTEGHCCPVLYQVAICHLLDPQLTEALDIEMQTVLFVQPRDALKGKPQCAHCLAEFPSMPRLRDHILRQKCLNFDPSRTDMPTPLDMDLLRQLYDGQGLQIFQNRDTRTRLTLQCQQCEASFTGPPQLLYHLQSCHGHLWTQATDWSSYLGTIAQTQSLSCVCNPGPTRILVTHQCAPHRQLAMMHIRHVNDLEAVPLADALPLPFSMTTDQVAAILPDSLPTEVLDFVCTCLQQRQFDALWHGAVAEYAKHHCIFCDMALQDLELLQHLHEVHSLVHHGATPLLSTLISVFMQSLSDSAGTYSTCPLCDIGLTTSVQAHLPTCVVALQTVSLVHLTQNVRIAGRPDLGRNQRRDERCLQTLDAFVGKEPTEDSGATKRRRTRGKTPEGQSQGTGKGQKSPAPRVNRDDGHGAAPEQTGSTSRPTTEIHARREFFGRFLGATSSRNPSGDDLGDPDMENGFRSQEGRLQSTQLPVESGLPDAPPSSATDCPGGSQERADPALRESTASAPRPSVASLEMGSPEEGVHGVRDRPLDFPEAPNALSGIGRSRQGTGSCPELSHPEGTGNFEQRSRTSAVADSVLHASSRHMAPLAAASASLGVATDSHEMEEVQSKAQCANPATDETVAILAVKSMPHDEHFALLAPLRFNNDSHWCYTNAALAAWMWSTLSHNDFAFSQWGTMQNSVANLLTYNRQQISENCINLRHFFPELFQRWQQDCRQGDAAEFTSLLLAMAKQNCVKQSWEQRLLIQTDTGFQITVHDHGEDWVPLNLAPTCDSTEAIEFADLFTVWSDYLGMTTALLAPTSLLCCQFERLNAADTRRDNPLTFHDPCQVPIFCGTGIDLDWLEYKPFAMISHVGSAQSGHYQMAFQVGAGRESLWLLLDDNCLAEPFPEPGQDGKPRKNHKFKLSRPSAMQATMDRNPPDAAHDAALTEKADSTIADFMGPAESRPLHSDLPETFRSGVTTIWLVRSDLLRLYDRLRNQLTWHIARRRLDLWKQHSRPEGPSNEALDRVLQILQNTNG